MGFFKKKSAWGRSGEGRKGDLRNKNPCCRKAQKKFEKVLTINHNFILTNS